MTMAALTQSYLHVPRKLPFTSLTMGQRFYQTVDRIPDKEMFVFFTDNERITFQQMKDQSQQFGASLVSLGMRKGDRMAFWGANHSEWLVGLYACIQLGIIPVPLSPYYPITTVAILLKKLQCKSMLLTRSPSDLAERTCELFPDLSRKSPTKGFESFPDLEFIVHGNLFSFDDHAERCVYSMEYMMTLAITDVNIKLVEEIRTSIDPDDHCLISFTSGTTGLPKAAVLSHYAVVNNIADTGAYRQGVEGFDDKPDSVRFGVTMSFAGSTCVSPVFLPAVRGCTSIIPHPVFVAETMAKAFQEERVTECIFFINHITALLNLPDIDDYDFSSLRLACLSGSTMPDKLRRRADKITKCITNSFGMTESQDNIANNPCDPQDVLDNAGLFPYDGHEMKIVDHAGLIVPINTKGELHMRGYPLFKFYWGDDQKTKEMKDENGWLHTGDVAEMDTRGFIYIRGRIKELIIKNAVNLAPAELETVLARHPAVNGVLVVGLPDELAGEEVCACIRIEEGKTVSSEEITEFCKGKVHAYLVPKHVVFVDKFPITDTGKFSRKDMVKKVLADFSETPNIG